MRTTRPKTGPEPRSSRHPRLREVAEEAGVSVTTVSVVLSGVANSGIPARTQERVRQAASRLGYVPNFSAQSLRTTRSHTLGFLTDGIATTPFAGEMISGAQAAAWKRDYVLLIVDTGGSRANWRSPPPGSCWRDAPNAWLWPPGSIGRWKCRRLCTATLGHWQTASPRSGVTPPSSRTRSAGAT